MLESWTRIIDSPFARVNHQAIFLEDCLYIFGGFNSQFKDVTCSSYQLDVFRWNIKTNRWEELKYPLRLKAWDCISKSWRGDPLCSNDGSVQPTHRFGHTVVAWRGRGWLFGGRTQQKVCSNQLYMFEPGTYHQTPSTDTTCSIHSSVANTGTNLAAQIIQPCWVEVVGLSGSAPSPRDGHAATVLENAMFIFGGFAVDSESFDDQVYRLDFETWSWTRIQIQPLSISVTSSFSSEPAPSAADGIERLWLHTTPLARDFASLISHQGRLFMFGGRSGHTSHRENDVYDSTLWELVPLKVMTQTAEHSDRSYHTENSFTPAWPSDCSCCTSTIFHHPVAGLGHLRRMVWEAETGNWNSDEFWATCSPRPCCLWRLCSANSTDWVATQSKSQPSNSVSDSHSRWCSGFATWRCLHFGHGPQYADDLLNQLYSLRRVKGTRLVGLTDTVAPYGRRSLCHWAYDGNLYVGFGIVRSHMNEELQLHYNDMWRFNLHTCTWTAVRPAVDNVSTADGVLSHLPSARRRAVACLYIPQPRYVDDHELNGTILTGCPQVFLFGGTQPQLSKQSTAVARHRRVIAGSRSLTSSAAGRLSLPQTWERVTQNQLLDLSDETIVHQADSLYKPDQIILEAPIAFLFVDPSGSVHLDHSTSLFYLVLVIPSLMPTPSSTAEFASDPPAQSGTHGSTLANVCVVDAVEMTRLLHVPSWDEVYDGGSIENLFHCADIDPDCDRLQLHQALRLAWSGVVLACKRHKPSSSSKYNGRRLDFLLVQQQLQPHFSEGHPATTASDVETSDNEPHVVYGSDPLILELHSYVLCDTGTVTRQAPSCTQGTLFWFCLLPTTNHILQNALNLLEECVKRVHPAHSSKSLSHWLVNPIAFRSSTYPSGPGSVNSTDAPRRSTFVWADSTPLLASADWQLSSSTQVCSDGDSCIPSTERSNTVASMLQLFLMHIRLDLESELLSKSSKPSTDASVEEPTEPLGAALTNQDQPPSSHDDVSLEQQEEQALDEVFLNLPSLDPVFLYNPLGLLQRHSEDEDHGFPFDPYPHLAFETIESSDSDDSNPCQSFHIDGVGSLVKGNESLVELSDCYILHLDTRLYDLCLRRLRGLGPKFLYPWMTHLPNHILHDLKGIYYESVMVNNLDRQSDSP